jgi:hypothetical protein
MPVVIDSSFDAIMSRDADQKNRVLARQQRLLSGRYDLVDSASQVTMSGGRMAVQQGARVKLSDGLTWSQLAMMSPEESKQKTCFQWGFCHSLAPGMLSLACSFRSPRLTPSPRPRAVT